MSDYDDVPTTPEVKLSRDQIRSKLLGSQLHAASKLIQIFGVEVELRQPSLKAIMAARNQDPAEAAIDMIIRFCYVPGTNDKLFENADRATIAQWPFGEDMVRLNTAIAELTGVDITQQEDAITNDPLSE